VPVRTADRVPGAEVEHPVGLHAEEQTTLVLVLVDPDVLLQLELLLADVYDLASFTLM
jgi:hypothetical protein